MAQAVPKNAPERPSSDDRFPAQVGFIVGNEACERFSFYGMLGILTLYASRALKLGDSGGEAISHYFKFGVYFMPLFGAWLSDRVLGRYRTILYISLFYCLGHAVLAFSDFSDSIDVKRELLYVGLVFLSIGGGGIKPCVSAFVGDQFLPTQNHWLQKAYGMFYWSINFGAAFAFLAIPKIRDDYGYGWAFGVPGIAMALATFIFWLGRNRYRQVAVETVTGGGGFWSVLVFALSGNVRRWFGAKVGEAGFWGVCRGRFTQRQVDNARQGVRVLGVLSLVPFFWALYDQNNSTWVVQGSRMVPYPLPEAVRPFLRWLTGDTIGAEQMQSVNSIQILILIPVFTYLLFPWIERLGLRLTTLRRMCGGMFITAASFAVASWLERRLDSGESVSVLWQTASYLVLTAGEILVSNTGIEFAFREAPREMRSTITSFWLLTVAVGNLVIARIVSLNAYRLPDGTEAQHLTVNQFFNACALSLFVVGILFVFVSRLYKYRNPDDDKEEITVER